MSLIEQYQQTFALHGDSPAAVQWPRGRQALRFDALTCHIQNNGFSILDYGCGLAHLKAYLDRKFQGYSYHAADIVPEFVETALKKYPLARIQLVQSYKELTEAVDHVVISGTFNIVEGNDAEEYLNQVQTTLQHLFNLSKVSLAVNFMTDEVDFMQPKAHHVNVEMMYRFFKEKLSPRLFLDQSYMPYEFTIVCFKDSSITRPENVYGIK